MFFSHFLVACRGELTVSIFKGPFFDSYGIVFWALYHFAYHNIKSRLSFITARFALFHDDDRIISKRNYDSIRQHMTDHSLLQQFPVDPTLRLTGSWLQSDWDPCTAWRFPGWVPCRFRCWFFHRSTISTVEWSWKRSKYPESQRWADNCLRDYSYNSRMDYFHLPPNHQSKISRHSFQVKSLMSTRPLI